MKKKKIFALAVIGVTVIGILTACSSAKSNNKEQAKAVTKITLATDGATKPFTYTKNGKLTGYDIEVAKAVFAQLPQYKVTYEITDFNSVIAGINSGRFQAVANDVSWTSARAPLYYFSSPLSLSNDAVAVRSGQYKKLADLAGKATEGLASSNYSALITTFNKNHPKKQIQLNYVDANDSLASRLSDVETGKTDFILYDAISLQTVIKGQALNLKIDKIKDDSGDPEHDGYDYLIFNKTPEGKKLQTAVNKVLKEFEADGTLKKLSQKYLGGDFVPAASKYN